MRNFPLQFLDEATIEHVDRVYRRLPSKPRAATWWARVGKALIENRR